MVNAIVNFLLENGFCVFIMLWRKVDLGGCVANLQIHFHYVFIKLKIFIKLCVRIPSVVYSIQENTVDEHTQTHSLNIIGSPGNLAALSNPVV
ncbi:MAG: hypothetical protein KBF68_09975, partial [Nitrosomonas sp.]|nr:hypothetical protein [Nitrosomonas sp.]